MESKEGGSASSTELYAIFESLPDTEAEENYGIISIDEILTQHPYLTINMPHTYFLYLTLNKDKLKDEDISLVNVIIAKLKRNEQTIMKKNLENLVYRNELLGVFP